jgi:CubicO group peptidase (beta-lactamase class C family)
MPESNAAGTDEAAFAWRTGPPEQQGFASAALDTAVRQLAEQGTNALLIIRHDQVVTEWYAPDWHARRKHYSASLAKALVGGMTLLVGASDGRLNADDPAARYVKQWAGDALKSRITLRHLATHSSGLDDAEEDGLPHAALPGWKGQFWRRDPNPFIVARDLAPVRFPPGTQHAYSNPGLAMLGYCVTAALRGTPQPDLWSVMRDRIFRPIGVDDDEWSIGYGIAYPTDGLQLYATWGGGEFTATAVARVGRLLLHGGAWNGQPVISPVSVHQMLEPVPLPLPDRVADPSAPASGLAWYLNRDGVWPSVPRDAFAGAGAGHRVLLVVPSLSLIIVRNGASLARELPFWTAVTQHLFGPLMATLNAPQDFLLSGL